MKKVKKEDVLKIIADFKYQLENRPTAEIMFDEVRMMRFKIKPLQGDISLLNLRDQKLIEILWNLGKLDEFFRLQHNKLNHEEKDLFFQFFDELYERFQSQLNRVDLRTTRETGFSSTIEVEIFKEETKRKKFN